MWAYIYEHNSATHINEDSKLYVNRDRYAWNLKYLVFFNFEAFTFLVASSVANDDVLQNARHEHCHIEAYFFTVFNYKTDYGST